MLAFISDSKENNNYVDKIIDIGEGFCLHLTYSENELFLAAQLRKFVLENAASIFEMFENVDERVLALRQALDAFSEQNRCIADSFRQTQKDVRDLSDHLVYKLSSMQEDIERKLSSMQEDINILRDHERSHAEMLYDELHR